MIGTEIDGIAGSSSRDTAGEILDLDGCDISELERGQGYLNDNHSNKLIDTLGRITHAKKIYKEEDCENERERYFWNKTKAPFLYFKGRLFDEQGDHRPAKAVAAILKHQSAADCPLKLKASVEGSVVKRDDRDRSILKNTSIKGVALTFSPANILTLVESTSISKSSLSLKDYENIQYYANQIGIKNPLPIPKYDQMISLKNQLISQLDELSKFLSMGSAGIGRPSDAIGGAALASAEPSSKIKYVDCPNCGKEQVYLPYQIKCSHCGKSFPFDMLYSLLVNK
jgi:hypothetical protein